MEGTSSQNVSYSSFGWLAVFGIAMGLLEAIVVVYLRELYHPGGFQFPLTPVPERTVLIETVREFCTIVMLAAAAAAAMRTAVLRFSAFLFLFGVWDLFYYAGLKAFLGWPPSLLTWDVLFLIPVTWLGPVLAPVLVSLTMIGLGLLIVALHIRYGRVRTGAVVWSLLGTGAFLIFLTFVWDYGRIIVTGGFLADAESLAKNSRLQAVVSAFVPQRYNWPLFVLGELLIIAGGLAAYRRSKSE